MEDSLKKRYITKLLSGFIAGVINILLISIVPKALGPIAFGNFSYLQQFFSQVLAFFDGGTSVAFFTKLSANNNRKELIVFYFIYSLLLLFLLYFFVRGVKFFNYTEVLFPSIPHEYIIYGLWFGFFTWISQVYIKISDSYALTVSVELIKIAHKLLSLMLLFFIIFMLDFDLVLYFYFNYISLLSFLMVITFLFFKKGILSKGIMYAYFPFRKLTVEFFEFSSPIFVFNIIAIAIGLFDIWLLQTMSGSVETGFYGLAYSVAAMCFLFTGAMTPIIAREFSKSYAIQDFEKIRELFKRYIPMLYSVAAYFSIFISFESEYIIGVFAGETFKGAYLVLVVISFYPIHQTYGQLSGSLFFSMGKTRLYRNIGIVSSIIGLIYSLIFIYFLEWGAVGFAWKVVLIQIISVNIQLYFNTKSLKLRVLPFLIHQLTSVLFFILMAYLSTQLFFISGNGAIVFLSKGVVYTIFVLVGVVAFPSIFSTSRKELLNTSGKLILQYRNLVN